MNDIAAPATITLKELEAALAEADPAALLIRKRLLRRVLWQRTPPSAHGLGLFTRQYCVVERDSLLKIVAPDELAPRDAASLPDKVILLGRSNSLIPGPRPRAAVLRQYWRLLFHARLELALRERFERAGVTEHDVQEKVEQIGRTEFAEITFVLTQENLVIARDDVVEVYVQFVAQFQELSFFAPHLLPVFFPSLDGRKDVASMVAAELDAAPIYEQTRLPGASEPATTDALANATSRGAPARAPVSVDTQRRFQLLRWFRRAERKGNNLRAALIQVQLAQSRDSAQTETVLTQAREQIRKLARRLQNALPIALLDEEKWYDALLPLLSPAARGFWPAEARLLYDLQKVCLDQERPLQSVSVLRWLVTLGRQPVVRAVPGHQLVLMLKHLRAARGRLRSIDLAAKQEERLDQILDEAIRHQEEKVRAHFRPLIREALAAVALLPQNMPETVARDKLIEELLDRIVEHGLLTMGDLRDAISRNQLKLDDLATADEFVLGDKLLRLNTEMANRLDNVYRPGEFYLRWMQSLSALAFGTELGRWLTRFLILPFGGAFIVLKFFFFMYLEIQHFVPKPPEPVPELVEIELFNPDAEWWELLERDPVHQETKTQLLWDPLTTPWSVAGLGITLFLLLHVPAFRHSAVRGIFAFGRWLHHLFVEAPARVLSLPVVQSVLKSPPVTAAKRYLLKPLVPAALVFLIAFLCRASPGLAGLSAVSAYVVAAVYMASRVGRMMDEILSNWLLEGIHNFSYQIIPSTFRAVLDLFKWLVAELERVLYGVDEWFRFRRGENILARGLKAFFGLFWLGLSYLVRFLVVLIIEPTVNPIKHFPVVTVAGKFMLLLLPILPSFLSQFMGRGLAGLLTSAIVFGLPGISGFLVWELKENWRLYRANRPGTLRPVPVGHHGETVLQLLRPGIHSGTIPKAFARWRAAAQSERGKATVRSEKQLAQVKEACRHFVDRELLALLATAGALDCQRLSVGRIHLSVQRILIEIGHDLFPPQPLVVALELRSSWLWSRLASRGWLEFVSQQDKDIVEHALLGLYNYAGATGPGEGWAPVVWEDWVAFWQCAKRDLAQCTDAASAQSVASEQIQAGS